MTGSQAGLAQKPWPCTVPSRQDRWQPWITCGDQPQHGGSGTPLQSRGSDLRGTGGPHSPGTGTTLNRDTTGTGTLPPAPGTATPASLSRDPRSTGTTRHPTWGPPQHPHGIGRPCPGSPQDTGNVGQHAQLDPRTSAVTRHHCPGHTRGPAPQSSQESMGTPPRTLLPREGHRDSLLPPSRTLLAPPQAQLWEQEPQDSPLSPQPSPWSTHGLPSPTDRLTLGLSPTL